MTSHLLLSVVLAGSGVCPGSGYLGPCPADVNGDGTVSTPDVLELLAGWGFNPCARADLDGNREVNVVDFLALLAQWGPCPPTNIVNIGTCRELNQPGTTYVLQADPPMATDTCFTITADDVILDGNGHAISGEGGSGAYGVSAIGHRRLVIRNLRITGFWRGINFVGVNDSLVEDNEFESIPLQAVYLDGNSDRNTIRSNSLDSVNFAGVQVNWGDDNAIRCNTIVNSGILLGGGAVLLSEFINYGNTIADNTMISDGGMADGVVVRPGSNETCVIGNTVISAFFDAFDINSDDNHVQDNLVDNRLTSGDTITLRGGASGNTLIDNVILGGASGYRMNGLHDTVIRGGRVEGTGNAALAPAAILVKGPCSGITIDGVTILGSLAEDFRVEALIDDLHVIDTPVGSYTIGPGLAAGLTVEDSANGLINFLAPVSGSGAAFSSDIQVSFNSALVDSLSQPGLDSPAEITLRGLPFADPVILRDGQVCPEPECTLLSYEGGTAVFRVESWTEYSIGEAP
jgi:hypothetical protein